MSSVTRSHTLPVLGPGISHASVCLVDGDDTVTTRLDRNGFGYYQVLLVLGIGVYYLSESIEMGAIAPLHTGLARVFKLSTTERASLPACVYAGSMVGMFLAGPLGDLFGRRGTLLFGIVSLLTSSLGLAIIPLGTPIWLILLLRAISGVAGSVGSPAAIALAVESCSAESRTGIMFAVMFLNSLGYMCESIGVAVLMPEFGEGRGDSWRGLSFLFSVPALISLPFVLVLKESPSLLAVKGKLADANEALNFMAWCNGKPTSNCASIAPDPMMPEKSRNNLTESLACVIRSYLPLMLLFVLIESSKSFFMSGSAYLCKDLFMMTGNLMAPSTMNILASITPLVGILVGSRLVFLGVRPVAFLSCLTAASSLIFLMTPSVRASASALLLTVLLFKLTYGPIGTCVNLMRVEAFPTEIRATAFGIVCVAGRLLCMLGPILIESLKDSARAESWDDRNLAIYLASLAFGAFVCGFLSLFVPPTMGNGRKLHDFVVMKDGKCLNMLDENEEDALLVEDDRFRSRRQRLDRGITYGSIMHGVGTRGMPELASTA